MATPRQKAEERPISFVLHDMAMQSDPIEVKLVIRPEDLTRTDTSRLTTTQTLGGAWGDNFGKGIPTIQIAGHTGWGSGSLPDGYEQFTFLYDTIFTSWHSLRKDAIDQGLDPDLVRLIFLDKLDDIEWVAAPQNFILKRNRSRPLLSMYQINLTWLSDDVSETKDALNTLNELLGGDALSALEESGLDSLLNSIEKMSEFISSGITAVLGPIKEFFDKVVSLTGKVLSTINRLMKSGVGVFATMTSGLLGIATSLTRAAANMTGIVQTIMTLPNRTKAMFQRVGLAFENAFCVLRNIFTRRRFLPNYDSLYGASLCSSTAGGRAISRYDTENPWPVLYPVQTSAVSVSSSGSAALSRLATADPVLKAPTLSQLGADLSAIVGGVAVTG